MSKADKKRLFLSVANHTLAHVYSCLLMVTSSKVNSNETKVVLSAFLTIFQIREHTRKKQSKLDFQIKKLQITGNFCIEKSLKFWRKWKEDNFISNRSINSTYLFREKGTYLVIFKIGKKLQMFKFSENCQILRKQLRNVSDEHIIPVNRKRDDTKLFLSSGVNFTNNAT